MSQQTEVNQLIQLTENVSEKKFKEMAKANNLYCRRAVIVKRISTDKLRATIAFPDDPNTETNVYYVNKSGTTLVVGQKAYLMYSFSDPDQGWLDVNKPLILDNTQTKVDDLINGVIPAGDASKLGGQPPSYYAPQSTIDSILNGTIVINKTKYAEIAEALQHSLTVGSKSFNGTANVTITKSDLSLGNVTNDKQIPYAEKGANGGVASLDVSGKVNEVAKQSDKVTNPITFTGGSTGSYNGSAPVEINIPVIPDLSIYEKISNKTSILSTGTDTQYPTAKAVWDLIQEVIATIPAGGLKVPISKDTESEVVNVDVNTREDGDYFFIQNMDITSPDHTGRIWVNTIGGTKQYFRAIDEYQHMDGISITQDGAGAWKVDLDWLDEQILSKIPTKLPNPELLVIETADGQTLEYDGSNELAIMLDRNIVGLDEVDNTSDMNKPVSSAQQQAIESEVNMLSNNVTDWLKNYIKTVNNIAPDASGNVNITSGESVTSKVGHLIPTNAEITTKYVEIDGVLYIEFSGGAFYYDFPYEHGVATESSSRFEWVAGKGIIFNTTTRLISTIDSVFRPTADDEYLIGSMYKEPTHGHRVTNIIGMGMFDADETVLPDGAVTSPNQTVEVNEFMDFEEFMDATDLPDGIYGLSNDPKDIPSEDTISATRVITEDLSTVQEKVDTFENDIENINVELLDKFDLGLNSSGDPQRQTTSGFIRKNGEDLDTIMYTGVYYCDTCTNRPTEINGWLQVFGGISNVKQVYHLLGTITQTTFARTMSSGVWGTWRLVKGQISLYSNSTGVGTGGTLSTSLNLNMFGSVKITISGYETYMLYGLLSGNNARASMTDITGATGLLYMNATITYNATNNNVTVVRCWSGTMSTTNPAGANVARNVVSITGLP